MREWGPVTLELVPGFNPWWERDLFTPCLGAGDKEMDSNAKY